MAKSILLLAASEQLTPEMEQTADFIVREKQAVNFTLEVLYPKKEQGDISVNTLAAKAYKLMKG